MTSLFDPSSSKIFVAEDTMSRAMQIPLLKHADIFAYALLLCQSHLSCSPTLVTAPQFSCDATANLCALYAALSCVEISVQQADEARSAPFPILL